MRGRLFLDYASPAIDTRPVHNPAGELACLVKLLQYLVAAIAVGSILSVGVASLIEFLIR